MKTLLIVALGGSLGAVARYLLSQGSKSWWGDSFPYGTLLVNVVGCLAIGILAGLGMSQLSPNMQKLVVVGITCWLAWLPWHSVSGFAIRQSLVVSRAGAEPSCSPGR